MKPFNLLLLLETEVSSTEKRSAEYGDLPRSADMVKRSEWSDVPDHLKVERRAPQHLPLHSAAVPVSIVVVRGEAVPLRRIENNVKYQPSNYIVNFLDPVDCIPKVYPSHVGRAQL